MIFLPRQVSCSKNADMRYSFPQRIKLVTHKYARCAFFVVQRKLNGTILIPPKLISCPGNRT